MPFANATPSGNIKTSALAVVSMLSILSAVPPRRKIRISTSLPPSKSRAGNMLKTPRDKLTPANIYKPSREAIKAVRKLIIGPAATAIASRPYESLPTFINAPVTERRHDNKLPPSSKVAAICANSCNAVANRNIINILSLKVK